MLETAFPLEWVFKIMWCSGCLPCSRSLRTPELLLCSCSAVFQVYEQLYDTLDIVGGPEVRAQATAKVEETTKYLQLISPVHMLALRS